MDKCKNEMDGYAPAEVEKKWQDFWEQDGTFCVREDDDRPKYYVLDMFPYPSGAGLHIGHPEGYTASDILTRYRIADGYNVLHPMGWDAFGLPAEQHALQTGTHPAINTAQNVDRFRAQIRRLGFAIDWSREINTTDPEYYRWTQWIFLQLFKHGLAYVDERPVWWCPELRSVLANEEVVNGRSERGDHPVERRPLRQWVLRITNYAEKLLKQLENLDWPDSTKRQQKAWIGRSEGAEIDFAVEGHREKIRVYTTRVDTIFGISYLVLAPEHPLVSQLTTVACSEEVARYKKMTAAKGDLERTDLAKGKTGVSTGACALHPLTGKRIPIWIADYVLPTYGTGAIMAVPAHDERDYEFAQKFNLPVIEVVRPKHETVEKKLPFCEFGVLCNSEEFDGLDSIPAKAAILQCLREKNMGRAAVNYKLRDWLFSRQRYWGEPVPIVWVDKRDYEKISQAKASPFQEFLPKTPIFFEENGVRSFAVPLHSSHLPLLLPEVPDYHPSDGGESPLAHATKWLHISLNVMSGQVKADDGEALGDDWVRGRRETNTMPQWAGSCWYHLRYLSPHCDSAPVDPKAERYWQNPDFYIGGAEHAVLHLLYARFWHQFLFEIGVVSTPEPYPRLFHQGIILGEDGNKMSKSRGNVVNPDTIVGRYGADTLRLYEMFLGPLEAVKPWDSRGIEGVVRFLRRVWQWFEGCRLAGKFTEKNDCDEVVERLLHESIQKVRNDIENLQLNTAISQLMILLNHMQSQEKIPLQMGRTFLQLLAPFAPHIAEELWQRCGGTASIVRTPFPKADGEKLLQKTAVVVLQVNGRLRGEIHIPMDLAERDVLRLARCHPAVEAHLADREIVREIYVANRLVNFVVR
ncbi:MAG: leucine--tRNA ligase [Puniceicoccales bacterium]|jgi:leucyl-tRNA synthetase|nr:leucine--tRNA ligase [Puniceicoccales bacterium]